MTTTQALTLPGTGKGDATFRPAAVKEAIELLGIVDPVEVKLANGTRRHGSHRWNGAGTTHIITVSTYLTPAEAGRTLWHELTHAAQREYLGLAAFMAAYRSESAVKGYRNNRFEIEARAHEDMNDDLPLAKHA